jgi:L-seryl-tRNA(Ser) seleniumtransferase
VIPPDLRRLPSVDAVLRHPDVAALSGPLPRAVVVDLVRLELAAARERLREGPADGLPPAALGLGPVVAGVLHRAAALARPSLRRIVNATGVVLHTNLGRAPLSAPAVRAMAGVAAGYSNLEYDLEGGGRGSRHVHVEEVVRRVTGAEAAVVVNNNAAAVLLVLAELAAGREVIVSRGQAVEIGGGFRIPDVLRQSGAHLVEVGTTNRTRLADYAGGTGPATAAFLLVHASNFRIVGFAESVAPADLAVFGRERGLPVVADQGSGCLLPTERFGIPAELREPLVQDYLRDQVDLVCFSGDKLLGGPQAGIVAGRAELVSRLKRHPLTRALRPDKVTLAGLAATLYHYQVGEAEREVPVWRMIGASLDSLAARAERWAEALNRAGVAAAAVGAESAVGGGSLPGVTLPTRAVAILPRRGSVDAAAAHLRGGDLPVVVRIADERLLVDPRTVLPDEEEPLLGALAAL